MPRENNVQLQLLRGVSIDGANFHFGRLTMTKTTFGGGLISPQVLAHLKRTQETAKTSRTEFGGGLIAPAVTAHVKRTTFGAGLITPAVTAHVKRTKVTFGGGLIHPRIARALAR
jgi:hypothetical protein